MKVNSYKVIDIHNHFYSREWLEYVATRTEDPTYEWTGPNSGLFKYDGIVMGHVDKPGDLDIDARVRELDELGIDVQLITHTTPGITDNVEVTKSVEWAKKVNDILVDACTKYPDRFFFLASIPAEDTNASLKEMERAHKLGARGIQMFSNVNGELASSDKFHPLYELAAELELVVQLHPAAKPLTADAMKIAGLPYQMYGFTMDTTMAVTSMIFKGVFDKYPKLKVHHCHLGGMAPFMIGRVDTAWKRFNAKKGSPGEWELEGLRLPSETYKEHVYIDTLSMHVPAIKCAHEYMGTDRLMFGSDYPHRASGSVPDNFSTLDQCGFTEEQKEKIYTLNAMKLYKLG